MSKPTEQMQGAGKENVVARTGDGWPKPVLHADDTLDAFITRHAEAMADTAGFTGPVRTAFVERSLSLGIRSWNSPDVGQTLVTYNEEALKSIKEKYLGREYDIRQIDDWKTSEAYWDNIRSARENPAAFVKETSEYVRHAQARALMQPGFTPAESDIYAFGETLRKAGFHKIAIDNAGEMFDAYSKMYANLGRNNPNFQALADTVSEKVTIAAQQGVVSDRMRDGILREISGLRENNRPFTAEENLAFEQKRTEGMKPYSELLSEMEYMRDSFAKRGNTSLGAGALPFHMALGIIEKVDDLQKIMKSGTPQDAELLIRNSGLEKWQRNPGSLTEYSNKLTEMDESHFRFFKRAHALMEATGWTPAVGAAKIMDNIIEGNRKGLSEKEITTNIAVDLLSEFGAKKLTGGLGKGGGLEGLDLRNESGLKKLTGGAASVAKEAMGEFVRVSATEFAKEPTREGLGKALSTGFYEAVTTTITKDVVKKLDPKSAEELREFLIESASKFGALEKVKPAIERIFSPPTKETSSLIPPQTVEGVSNLNLPQIKTKENLYALAGEVQATAVRENVRPEAFVATNDKSGVVAYNGDPTRPGSYERTSVINVEDAILKTGNEVAANLERANQDRMASANTQDTEKAKAASIA